MRYFTKELWTGAQDDVDSEGNANAWNTACERYREQLMPILAGLDDSIASFFLEADVHDGRLVSIEIRDGRHVTYSGEEPVFNPYPVAALLVIRNHDDSERWSISYSGIKKSVVDFPSDSPAFFSDGEGFNDIGYDELTEAGNGFLRHEILFSSGASILLEFKEMKVQSNRLP